MVYKRRNTVFRITALFMSLIMLITVSPIISLASSNFSGYSIFKAQGNNDFAEYLADALSKGENRIGLGIHIQNVSNVEITSALKSIEGRRVKAKKKKMYLSKPTPRIIGSKNQNPEKRTFVFKEGSDIRVWTVKFDDPNLELIIQPNAKVVFEECIFSNTIKNYGEVTFKRRCKFETGKIENYGKVFYANNQTQRPENIAQQADAKLKCEAFSKKFTVGQAVNETVIIKTLDNKNTSIEEIGFLNGDNQLIQEFNGVKLELENNQCKMSGTPEFALKYRVQATVIPEGETERIKEVLSFDVEKLYEDKDNAYCVIEENKKDGDDFKDYFNEAVRKNFTRIKLGRNIKNVGEVNITKPVKYIEGANTERKNGKIYISGATYRAIGEKDSSSKGKIVFKSDVKVDVYGIYFQNKDVEVIIEQGADVGFERCHFSNTITNYGEAYFKKCEFKTNEIANYGYAKYKKMNEPKNIAQDIDYKLVSDTFSKDFTVGKEIDEKIAVVTNKNKSVSIEKIGFLKELSSEETLTKISGMKIEEKDRVYSLKGKPVKEGKYYVKITALPNGGGKSISTVFTLYVKEADILGNEYCVMPDKIKNPDDFKAYLEEAEGFDSTCIRLGRDITKVSEANISSKLVLIEGNSIKKKGSQLYLSGATPRSIGSKENNEKGKIVFPKDATIAVKGINFDSENVDIVIEEGADVWFNRCSFAHTPTNYGKAHFRKCEFKTGQIADYGKASYEKTKKPTNIAEAKTKLVCTSFDKKFKVNKYFEEELKVTTDKNERVNINKVEFLKDDNTTTSYLNGLSIQGYSGSWFISGKAGVAGAYKVKIAATVPTGEKVEQVFILTVEPADIPVPEFEIDSSALEDNELKGEEEKALDKKVLKLSGKDADKAEFKEVEVYDISGYSPIKVEDVKDGLGLLLTVADNKKTVDIEGTPTAKLAKGKYKITVKATAQGLDNPKTLDIKLNIKAKPEELRLISDISEKVLRVNERIENGGFYIKDSLSNQVTIKEIKFLVGADKMESVDGITLQNDNGALLLIGTPEKEGAYRIYVEAESNDGKSLKAEFTFNVQAALPNLDDVVLVSDLSGRIFEQNKKITNESFEVKDSRGYYVEVKSLKFASNNEPALDGMYLLEQEGLLAITGTPNKAGEYIVKIVAKTREDKELTGDIKFEVKQEEAPVNPGEQPKPEPNPNSNPNPEPEFVPPVSAPDTSYDNNVFIAPLPVEEVKTADTATEINDTQTPLSSVKTRLVKPSNIEAKIGDKRIKVSYGNEIKTITSDVPIFMKGSTPMLPLRAVAEAAGFDVTWNKGRKVILKKGNNKVVIYLKTDMMYIGDDEVGIKINPIIKERRVFLPVTEITKALMMKTSDFKIIQVK